MPQAQEASPNEQVAENEQLRSFIRRGWNIYRNRQTPVSDTSNIQADLSDRASHTWSMPQAQEASPNEVAKTEGLGTFLWGALNAYRLWSALNADRDTETPDSDTLNMQADLSDFANGGNIDLDALTDQLQNILNSQPSATTPTESVAEAQRRRYWPIVRDFLNNIFSPTDAPSEQPDTNALAESLENTLNRQILVGAGRQPVARTQVWSSIRNFVGNLFGKSSGT